MTTLGAYIIVHNEQELLRGCVDRLLLFVDELLIVDHGSTDDTTKLVYDIERENPKKVCAVEAKYQEPVDMGALRTNCYQLMKSDWVLNVDADEYYPAESLSIIREVIQNPRLAISFRVPYFNLAWRPGYVQDQLEHYPDRVYRRDVVDKIDGLLPNDMHHVKKEFYTYRPFLEYDNADDKSFENPKQPILRNAPYYHLARTRGYNFEFNKWLKYNRNLHPRELLDSLIATTKTNQWVNGLYPMRQIDLPKDIPAHTNPKPTVSVIIPNHDYARFVGEAIESCLNQTYPVHEVIVVDDNSRDNSVQVINEWIAKDKRVSLVQQRHDGGVASVRNIGVAQSTSDYFVCLDADDKLDSTFVEKTVARAQSTLVEIVFTDIHMFGDREADIPEPEFSSDELKRNQCVPSACALIERHVFDASGGFALDEWYEDYGWWLRLDKLGFRFVQIHEPLFCYRKHGPSRIDMLDEKQQYGFDQLRMRYGKIIN
jgi:glycosyltransferase involved in cell wall biosynthesis